MITVFDTNIYLKLGSSNAGESNAINEIKNKENSQVGIHPIVLMELYSLFQRSSKSRENAFIALRMMAKHGGQYCPMIPLTEVQLAKQFFNIEVEASLQTQYKLNEMLIDFAKYDSDIVLSRYSGTLDKINRFIQQGAATYIDAFYSLIPYFKSDYKFGENINLSQEQKRHFLSFVQSNDFKIQTALAQIMAVYNYLGNNGYDVSQFSIAQLKKFAIIYLEQYPAPIAYRQAQFIRAAECDTGDLSSILKDDVWIQHILHVIGQRILDESITFVTEDQYILSNAKPFCPESCLSWDDYKQKIGYSQTSKYQLITNK